MQGSDDGCDNVHRHAVVVRVHWVLVDLHGGLDKCEYIQMYTDTAQYILNTCKIQKIKYKYKHI
jgi:hypothetical protein